MLKDCTCNDHRLGRFNFNIFPLDLRRERPSAAAPKHCIRTSYNGQSISLPSMDQARSRDTSCAYTVSLELCEALTSKACPPQEKLAQKRFQSGEGHVFPKECHKLFTALPRGMSFHHAGRNDLGHWVAPICRSGPLHAM